MSNITEVTTVGIPSLKKKKIVFLNRTTDRVVYPSFFFRLHDFFLIFFSIFKDFFYTKSDSYTTSPALLVRLLSPGEKITFRPVLCVLHTGHFTRNDDVPIASVIYFSAAIVVHQRCVIYGRPFIPLEKKKNSDTVFLRPRNHINFDDNYFFHFDFTPPTITR